MSGRERKIEVYILLFYYSKYMLLEMKTIIDSADNCVWEAFIKANVNSTLLPDNFKEMLIERLINDERSKALWIKDPEYIKKEFANFIIETNFNEWSNYVINSEIPQPFKGGVIRANELMLLWIKNPTAIVSIVNELKEEYVKNATTINKNIDTMMRQIQKFNDENYKC